MAETVDVICYFLGNASGGVGTVDDLAWEGFGMALPSGEVVIIVIKRHVESIVIGGDTRDVVQNRIEGFSGGQMRCPVISGFDAVEKVGACWTAVLRL